MPQDGTRRFTPAVAALTVVALCTLATFWPALSARAAWLDDNDYVARNDLVTHPGWASARRLLGEVWLPSTVRGYYHPLAMISLMLDAARGGTLAEPAAFHQTHLVLHTLNALLAALLVRQLVRSWLAAAAIGLLFGVHPVQVESVLWIAERKTLLASFFALLSLNAYVAYIAYARPASGAGPQRGRRRWIAYAATLLCFALALLSKPTAVPLPLLLLVLDYWPLRRLSWRSVVEKAPHFGLALLGAIVTYVSQARSGDVASPLDATPAAKGLLAAHNLIFYLRTVVLPIDLRWYHPFPEPFGITQPAVLTGVIGSLVLAAAVLAALRFTRAPAAGLAFFALAVFPSLGVVGFTSAVAANRFAYLPCLGLYLPLAAWIAARAARTDLAAATRIAPGAATAVVALIAAGLSRSYMRDWRDTDTLSLAALRQAPDAPLMQNFRANHLSETGRLDEAIELYRRALRVNPAFAIGYFNLGNALFARGEYLDAARAFELAVVGARSDPRPLLALAAARDKLERFDGARDAYRAALRLRPGDARAHRDLASVLLKLGDVAGAVAELHEATRLGPADAAFRRSVALLLSGAGRFSEAIDMMALAVQADPQDAASRANFGSMLASAGRQAQAVEQFEAALRLDPSQPGALIGLGVLAARREDFATAAEHFRRAADAHADNLVARVNLSAALERLGRFEEAALRYAEAVRLDPRDLDLRLSLAGSLKRAGRIDDAAREIRAVLDIEPGHAQARADLAGLSSTRPAPP